MGNTCCQDQPLTTNVIDNIQQKYSSSITSQYYEAELPQDEQLLAKFEQIKSNPQFRYIVERYKVLKHKFFDRFYLGGLSEKGYPIGLGILYEPQNYLYHGHFNSLPDGQGTLELIKQQIIYSGMFKQGKAEGQGKIQSKNNRVQFEGSMSNSIPKTGKLKINYNNDLSISCIIKLENFPDGPVKVHYGDKRIYVGPINKRSFAPEGKGAAYYPDHSHYEGEFEQGQFHGKGSFYWCDGSSYHGDYQHGKKHGNGTFNYNSRRYYEGQWINGKQSGTGAFYEKTGILIKKGIWKSGLFQRQL